MNSIVEVGDPVDRVALCRAILEDLPDWFGRSDATAAYARAASGLTMFAWEADGTHVGFAGLKRTTPEAFDIHVMGILRRHHRQGAGRALVVACEDHARTAGAAFLTVQTVGPSAPDPFYAQTRAFYSACGMAGLAEFSNQWGQGTPMLLMGKAV